MNTDQAGALAKAISVEVQSLMRMMVSPPMALPTSMPLEGYEASAEREVALAPVFRKSDDARRVLRVEVEHEFIYALLEYGCRYDPPSWDKPLTFQGVAVYEVRHILPPCGWQLINPMKQP